jgi:mycothiol synthase
MELRPVEVGDRAALDALFSLADECDGHFPIGEHKYLDLMVGAGPSTGLVAVEHDTVIAYVALSPPRHDSMAALEMAIHPLHRSHAVIDELVREGVAAASEMYAAAVRVWAFQPNMVDRLRAAGFRTERELRQLRIDLPTTESAPPPAGMEERRFRPGADEEAWLAVNNAAFSDHPENGSWTREILADRLDQPWFDVEGFVMLWEGATLTGFCWTKPHDDIGEVYVIAAAPAYQGRGVGRFLVVRGLQVISDHYGFDQAMLYMDSDNARAAALYDSLSFRLHHVDRSMTLELVE